jgi:drug/metabolite transporter (DMT)-like permease
MTWLIVALAAYFLISLNLTMDKVILKNAIPQPVVYCFYMGLLSIFGLVFLPFGKLSFDWNNIATGIVVGAVFLGALFMMYKAVFVHEASRVGPIIGAVTPIFVSLFSFLFLNERLGWNEFLAFALLVAGGILISVDLNDIDKSQKRKAALRVLGISILSALIFGIYYVLLKHVYNQGTFVSGFVWTRVGSFLASFLFLIPASNRKLIFGGTQHLKLNSGVLVLANKTLSGVAFALLNYAIAIGSVTLVNAMQGLQYVFLLGVVAFLSKKYPRILSEQIHKKALTQKITAIIVIAAGLALTAL